MTEAKPGTAPAASTAKRSKYNAGGEHVEGVWMASAAQAVRFRQLLKMRDEGRITYLRTEVPFPLVVNNVTVCTYRADFVYCLDLGRGVMGEEVIEEVKGLATPEWKIKKKLFEAIHRREIAVIDKPKRWPEEYLDRLKNRRSLRGWIEVYWSGRLPTDPQ